MFASLLESFNNGDIQKQTPIEFDPDTMTATCPYASPACLDDGWNFDSDPASLQVMIVGDYNQQEFYPAAFCWNADDMAARADEFGSGDFVVVYTD